MSEMSSIKLLKLACGQEGGEGKQGPGEFELLRCAGRQSETLELSL